MRTRLLPVICLILNATLANAAESASSNALVPADWQALHDRWQSAMKELSVPGMSVVVVKGGDVVLLDALGVCDPQGQQRVTPRSPFYLASVTKSFTALGIAILVDEGKVRLDEPVKTYLPQFTLADADVAEKITVRDLLAHRRGLDSSPITISEAYLGNIDDERYYRLMALVEPGERFRYSNLHYTLAGRIIAAVTGQKWQDFLAERVFAPLGMVDATCYASQLYANPFVAWPIVEKKGELQRAPLVKSDNVMHAAGGMGASAADLGNWLAYQITGKTSDGKQLISPKLLEEVHAKHAIDDSAGGLVPELKRDGYSLGWFTGSYHGHPMLEHGGGYIGTSTVVSFLPEDHVGVAVLVNESSPFTMLVLTDVYNKLLGVEGKDLMPQMRELAQRRRERQAKTIELTWVAPSAANGLDHPPSAYAGVYYCELFGKAEIALAGDQLVFQLGELPLRWHASGPNKFRVEIPGGDVAQGGFDVAEDGAIRGLYVLTPDGKAAFERQK